MIAICLFLISYNFLSVNSEMNFLPQFRDRV